MLFCQLRTALIENPSASPRVGFDQRKDSSEQLRTAPRLRLHGKCLISFTTLQAKRYIIRLSGLKKSLALCTSVCINRGAEHPRCDDGLRGKRKSSETVFVDVMKTSGKIQHSRDDQRGDDNRLNWNMPNDQTRWKVVK